MNQNEVKIPRLEKEQRRFTQMVQTLSGTGKLLYAGSLLARASRLYADRVALIFHDTHISYKELFRRVVLFSQILRKRGVKTRDRVLVSVDNSPEFYIAYFAAWHLGAIVVPLNIFLQDNELNHIIKDSLPSAVVVSQSRLEQFKNALNDYQCAILTPEDMPDHGTYTQQEEEVVQLGQDEMCTLLYTSGTTGVPKGVMLSSKNIVTNLLQAISRLDLSSEERVMAVLPLFHVLAMNTCVWGPILLGATIIIVPKIERRYIIEGLKHKPSYFLGVPALYGLLCLMKHAPVDEVKYFGCGGDALPDKIRAAFALVYRRKICCGFGLTETSPILTLELDDYFMPASNVGFPLVGVHIQIRDEQGNVLPAMQIGIIWVKGDNVMLGYYNAPEATEKALHNGWFDTGDLGYLDSVGRLTVTGRIKDLIINKGFNIYPQEIENIILLHPLAIGAGVVGLADEQVGEIPIAYVQVRSMSENIEHEVRVLCERHLASYKIPRYFICSTKELPKTATAKIDKKVLRKWLKGELDAGSYTLDKKKK